MFFSLQYAFLIEIPIKIWFCCAKHFAICFKNMGKNKGYILFKKIGGNLTLSVPRLVQNYTNQKYVKTKYFQ